jgi:hypothetical protein
MFYIGIKSGLGNQMFQYAYGLAASLETGIPFALDISNYEKQYGKDTPRDFSLQHFNISAPVAPHADVRKFHGMVTTFIRRVRLKFSPLQSYVFKPGALRVQDGQYYEGLWQSESFFIRCKDRVRTELSLKEPLGKEAAEALSEINLKKTEGCDTILVHVRRGDYVTNPHSVALLGVLEADYFINCIRTITEKLDVKSASIGAKPKHVFFATEDRAWAEENVAKKIAEAMQITYSFITRPGIKDYEEMMVMSHCDHFVISNSSFSWWAAWLSGNDEKTVVAPKRWIVDPNADTKGATPDNWLRI